MSGLSVGHLIHLTVNREDEKVKKFLGKFLGSSGRDPVRLPRSTARAR